MPQLPHLYDLLKFKYKSAKKLSKMAGISESTMSRILAGKAEFDKSSARKLASALEKDLPSSGIAFFVAYLRDQLPKSMHSEISIHLKGHGPLPSNESDANTDPRLKELVKLCATYAMVPEKVRITIRKYAEFFLKEPARAELIIMILDLVFTHYEQEIALRTGSGKSQERGIILKALSQQPPANE